MEILYFNSFMNVSSLANPDVKKQKVEASGKVRGDYASH